jgi:hypothetical protein
VCLPRLRQSFDLSSGNGRGPIDLLKPGDRDTGLLTQPIVRRGICPIRALNHSDLRAMKAGDQMICRLTDHPVGDGLLAPTILAHQPGAN